MHLCRSIVVVVVAVAACGKKEEAGTTTEKKPVEAAKPIEVPPAAKAPFEVPAPTDAVVGIGRGPAHACVVRASGAVDCWGQSKDSDTRTALHAAARPAPWRVDGITDAVGIDTRAHCIVRKSGEAACLDREGAFKPVPGIAKATHAGGSCFIVDGRLQCLWEDKLQPVKNVANATSLQAGDMAGACVLTKDRKLSCSEYSAPDSFQVLAGVNGVDEVSVTSTVGAGDLRACVRQGDKVSCFRVGEQGAAKDKRGPLGALDIIEIPALAGAKNLVTYRVGHFAQQPIVEGIVGGKVVRGELPLSGTELGAFEPVPQLTDAKLLAPGCAVRTQGSVVCWGDNRSGVLGQPTTLGSENVAATVVAGLRDVEELEMGSSMVWARTRAGQLFQWGSRAPGSEMSSPTEVKLANGPSSIAEIDATFADQLCVRSSEGKVWCELITEEMGDPTGATLAMDSVKNIAVSGENVFAIRTDGSLVRQQVFSLTGATKPEPVEKKDVVEVSGNHTTCMRTKDGNVECENVLSRTFAAEPAYKGATAMATGDVFDCALVGGKVMCRTYDKEGKPGAVAEIAGPTGVTDIAAAREQVCAVHGGGTVSCWSMKDGKPGSLTAVIEKGARDIELGRGRGVTADTQLMSGHGNRAAGATGCAIMTDTTVMCWGANVWGELGDGSLVRSKDPVGIKL